VWLKASDTRHTISLARAIEWADEWEWENEGGGESLGAGEIKKWVEANIE
jgi:hypothetical protein